AMALGAAPRRAAWAAIAYGFGTIAFNHAVLFGGHDTSAFFLFASFSVLFFIRRKGRRAALGLLAGLCAGLAVLCDQIAVFGAVLIVAYALAAVKDLRTIGAFLA